MSGDFNPIFEELVLSTEENSDERLICLLTYSLYKLDKNDYFKEYYKTHGTDPTIDDVNKFLLSYNNRRLKTMKDSAASTLYTFAENYLQDRVEELQKEAIKSQLVTDLDRKGDEIAKHVKKKVGWIPSIACSMIGGVLFTGAVVLAVAIFSSTSPNSNYAKLFDVLVHGKDFKVEILKPQGSDGQ